MATITRNGRMIECNETLREMLGTDAALASGGFLALLRPGDRIFWDTHVGPLLDMQGHVREIAMELRTDTGSVPVLLNARSQVPGDPSSSIDIAVFPAKDRRSYEQELLASRRRAEQSEANARVLATTLQRSLFPPSLPDIPGLELGAAYRPVGTGAEVGGDFYDFFRVTADDWMIAVGDVCGKGAAAAAVTALVRYSIRGAAMETESLQEVMHGVNATLLLDRSHETCTALLARLSPAGSGHRVSVIAAGHPLPRLVTASGRVTPVGQYGVLLGAFTDVEHRTDEVTLEDGDSLVFFTDGVTEARNGEDFFGETRLDELLGDAGQLTAPELARKVVGAAFDFQSGEPRDDAAVVVVRQASVGNG